MKKMSGLSNLSERISNRIEREKPIGMKLVIAAVLLVLGLSALLAVTNTAMSYSSAASAGIGGTKASALPSGESRLAPSFMRAAGVALPNPPAIPSKGLRTTADPAAPTGVTDYGENAGSPYSYYAESVWSHAYINRLYLDNCAQSGTTGCTLGYQENAIDQAVWECNSNDQNCRNNQFWTQDVVNIAQTGSTTFNVDFFNNIWNFTTGCSDFPSPIHGNGSISGSGCGEYYSYGNGAVYGVYLPFQIWIWMNSYVNSAGNAVTHFYYDICDNSGCSGVVEYDTVTYNSAGGACSSCTGDDQYYIAGGVDSGYGLPFDLEGDLAGGCCGNTITVPAIYLFMWDSEASTPQTSAGATYYVPHAYSYGSDTAETASNVMMEPSTDVVPGVTGPNSFIQVY